MLLKPPADREYLVPLSEMKGSDWACSLGKEDGSSRIKLRPMSCIVIEGGTASGPAVTAVASCPGFDLILKLEPSQKRKSSATHRIEVSCTSR